MNRHQLCVKFGAKGTLKLQWLFYDLFSKPRANKNLNLEGLESVIW